MESTTMPLDKMMAGVVARKHYHLRHAFNFTFGAIMVPIAVGVNLSLSCEWVYENTTSSTLNASPSLQRIPSFNFIVKVL